MTMTNTDQATIPIPTPSRLLLEYAQAFSKERPLLDVGCGTGRNALALAQLGFHVVCVDSSQQRLDQLANWAAQEDLKQRITLLRAALAVGAWPFEEQQFSAIICVHYLDVALLPLMSASLCRHGHIFIETVGGQGRNHLELPIQGTLRRKLASHFRFEFYQERPVGPARYRKQAVKLCGQKFR